MKIDELYLDFTLPGHSIELKPGGKNISVDMTNLADYIDLVVEWTLRKGIQMQLDEFKSGFSSGKLHFILFLYILQRAYYHPVNDLVFAVRDLQSFTSSELVMMTGALDEDWSIEGELHPILGVQHHWALIPH